MWTSILKTIATILPFLLPLLNGKVADPKNHNFFGEISRLRKYILPTLQFIHKNEEDAGRTLLWKDMLLILLEVWEKEITDVVKQKKCSGICMITAIRKILETSELKWQAIGIPQIVIDKFKNWEAKHMEALEVYLTDISTKGEFNSHREKQSASLYLMLGTLNRMFSNIGYSLGSINGGLSGHIHKGVECK